MIRPEPGWVHWDEGSSKVHNIPREKLLLEGLPALQVAEELNRHFKGLTLYSDAQTWDGFWLDVLIGCVGVTASFSFKDISEFIDGSEHRLMVYQAAKEDLVESWQFQLHRASDDARIIHRSLIASLGIG